MEQNKFEKNIQQKLDELKIKPSGSVWQNVEKRIAIKDQRRWKAFILFFLFLVISSGGYWLLNSQKNNKPQGLETENISQKNMIVSTLQKKDSSLNQATISDKNDTGKVVFKSPATLNTPIVKNEYIYKPKSRKTTSSFNQKRFQTEIKKIISSEDKTINKQPDENVKNIQKGFWDEKTVFAGHEDEKVNRSHGDSVHRKNGENSVVAQLEKEKEETDTTNLVENSKKLINLNQKRKWILGITISGGTSLLRNNLLGINNYSSDFLSSPSPSTGGSVISPPYALPAETRNSVAFIAGVFAEKNISVKHKISIGINYKYFSTVNKVGSKIDSIQTAYNSLNSTNSISNYRNNFNYLALPVSLKFKLGNSKSLPLYWQAGINLSQLVSAKALQFKNNPGIYYSDNSLFNKTQLAFSTGLSVTLFSKHKNPLTIGPYFYYSASKLANEGLYNKKHFSFIGISTEILFKKNN